MHLTGCRAARWVRIAGLVTGIGLSGIACESIDSLKNQLMGSGRDADEVNPELEAIREAHAAGQCASVLPRIDALIQDEPGLAEAHYFKGRCHLALAPPNPRASDPMTPEELASLEAFQRALAVNPRHAPSAVGLGDLYSRRVPDGRRGRSEDPEDPYELARTAYDRAVAIDPTSPEAQASYAAFLARTGDLAMAETAYQAAAQAAATEPEVAPDYYLAYGRFLSGPGNRLDDALDQFELARVFRQDDPAIEQEIAIIYSRVGIGHFEKEEYLLAEEALRKASDLFPDPNIPEAQRTAETLAKLGAIRRR